MDRSDAKRFSHAGTPIQGNPATSSDRVQAPVAGAGPTDCGRGQTSLSEYFGIEKPLEQEGEIDPFRRRESIPRSPPKQKQLTKVKGRQRSDSCPDLDFDGETLNPTKRKRVNRTEGPKEDSGEDGQRELQRILEDMFTQIVLLEKTVTAAYKPKKEFLDISTKLSLSKAKLHSKSILDWMSKEVYATKSTTIEEELRAEVATLKKVIQDQQVKEENEKSAATTDHIEKKCAECTKAQLLYQKRSKYTRYNTHESFQSIPEDDWGSDLFADPQVLSGPIWEAPSDWDLILPCSSNIESNYKEVEKAILKFGGREGLKAQKKVSGEVAVMMNSLGFPDDKGNFNTHTRWIYSPILNTQTAASDEDDYLLFQALCKIKSYLVTHKRSKLAIPEMDDVTGLVMTRMLRFLLADTAIELCIFRPTAWKTNKANQSKQPPDTQKNIEIKHKPRPMRKEDALVIKKGEKSYAELLKTIKEVVKPTDIGVDIKGVRKTRNGDLLLNIKNGADKAEVLRKEIGAKLPDLTAMVLTNKKVLHVKNLDEVTTVEEVTEAICKELQISQQTFEVRALRPAFGGRQNVTLVMREGDATNLLAAKTIKIGWGDCSVAERKNDAKCHRCWEYGHQKANCTGPNREQQCLKCGKQGHKARECSNKPYCIFCKEEGHQSGNRKCSKSTRHKKAETVQLTASTNQNQN